MQAIILAAGMGKRLGDLTKENTKCMIKVHSETLIERMLGQLASYSIERIIIVIGYQGDKVQALIGDNFKGIPILYVENPIYDKTNNIYSLYLAKDELIEDDTLLIESDLIFDSSVLECILNNPYPSLALVAKYESWMDGTVVTLDPENNITGFISKKAFDFTEKDKYYKTVNIYKFSKSFSSNYYVPFLEAYIKARGNNEYYEQVLRVIALLDKPGIKALPLSDERWYEIDDLQDLTTAEAVFSSQANKLSLFQKRYGGYWRFPYLIDFCYLVNPFFPTAGMVSEMKSNFEVLLTEYPSGMQVNAMLMAKYFGINESFVSVGNGAAELIKSLMDSIEGQIGVVYPTFEEYSNRLDESQIVSFIPDNKDFSYTVDDLISYFESKLIKTLLLVNPDNPSGNYINKADLFRLIKWSKEQSIDLIIDESFVDFSDETQSNTLLDNGILAENKHLVVVKSISKSYGVPGLRLGILASGNEELIQQIRKDVTIWNINSFAEFYMQIFNKYETDYIEACQMFITERNRFYKELTAIDFLRVIPSQANYFLCEVKSKYSSSELTDKLLQLNNILIKDCSTKKGFDGKNYVRIAIRSSADNIALVEALSQL